MKACQELNGLEVGKAKMTESFNLPCRAVIHTCGPRYIDGAHNEGGWRSLRENIRAYFTGRPLIYICGVLADKEYEKMVDIMAPFASFIITVTPDNPRALDKEILAECYRSYGKPVDTAEDVFAAQRQAETLAQELTEPVIVVFGSLSFIGPLIPRISSTINQERTTEKK